MNELTSLPPAGSSSISFSRCWVDRLRLGCLKNRYKRDSVVAYGKTGEHTSRLQLRDGLLLLVDIRVRR
jgi:hypothetical protein